MEVLTPKQLLEQLGPRSRARWGLGHGSALVQMQIRTPNGQKKARVQSTPGRVMGTLPLSPEEGGFGDLCSWIVEAALNEWDWLLRTVLIGRIETRAHRLGRR